MRIVKVRLGLGDQLLLRSRSVMLYLHRVTSLLNMCWYTGIVLRLKVLFPALTILVNF